MLAKYGTFFIEVVHKLLNICLVFVGFWFDLVLCVACCFGFCVLLFFNQSTYVLSFLFVLFINAQQ